MREIDTDIVYRFLAGNASLQDQKEVEDWYQSFDDQSSLTSGFTQIEFQKTSAKMWDNICQSILNKTESVRQSS